MIYLAATDMLEGMATLLSHPDASFALSGSSTWSFVVHRTRRDGLHLRRPDGRALCRVSEADYAVALWRGTQQLVAAHPPACGGPLDDLRAALTVYPTEYRR
jgi:hypothetical protein